LKHIGKGHADDDDFGVVDDFESAEEKLGTAGEDFEIDADFGTADEDLETADDDDFGTADGMLASSGALD